MSNSILLPAEKRPISMRRRADLVVQEGAFQGERSWIIKDPVGMKYFRLLEPEHEAFKMLDGRTSHQQIKQQLDQQFPDYAFPIEDVHLLINSFHQNGLLISDSVGQSHPLQTRRNKELKQKATQLLMSVMALRFPGVDPERFLAWLHPKVRWFFSPACTIVCLLICFSAAVLLLHNLDEFFRRLPEFNQFFNLKNILFMGGILIVTKSIHELGHGLMCKHFGGECHEIGFMFLVLMPAMYCNTSDSWILPNKWHRIAIGAAGMYMEIVIAAICTFIWWYTHPGMIHYLALNVIFLCSVSTLLFNANPLLRYDGYYMLADYLEIPNLAQKSKTAMTSKARVICLAMPPIKSRLQPVRNQSVFALYSVASFLYRWFVILMIFWFLSELFEPYGLAVLAHLMIAMSVVGMVMLPLFKLTKFFMYPGRMREVNTPHLIRTTVVCGAIAAILFFLPLPHSVRSTFVTAPAESQKLFVGQPGLLKSVNFRAGDTVNSGDVVAVLENTDMLIALERLKGQAASLKADLAAFRLSETRLPTGTRMITETNLQVANVEKRIRLVQEQLKTLNLVANRTGVVIEPPNVVLPETNGQDSRTLVAWSGTPLDTSNESAFLERGTLFCLVGDPQKMKATLLIDQSVIKFVAVDQPVTLMFDEHPGQRFSGVIQSVSRKPIKTVPRELALDNGGTVATKPMASTGTGGSEMAPLIPSYEATVLLDEVDGAEILTGFRGQAKIRVGYLPIGQRFLRYLSSVVNFR